MKNKISIFFIVIIMIIFSLKSLSLAATENINVSASSTSVKSGETFTVTISEEFSEGLEGMEAKLVYDENIFEITGDGIKEGKDWTNLGDGNTLSVISKNAEQIKSSTLYTITFKVKENVEETTSEIKLTNIESFNADNRSKLEDKSVTITISNKNDDNPNNNPNNNQNDDNDDDNNNDNNNDNSSDGNNNNNDNNNDNVNGGNSNNNSNENKQDANNNSNNNPQASEQTNNSENSKNEDKSNSGNDTDSKTKSVSQVNAQTSTSILPKTGNTYGYILLVSGILLIVISIASYKGYQRYKGI